MDYLTFVCAVLLGLTAAVCLYRAPRVASVAAVRWWLAGFFGCLALRHAWALLWFGMGHPKPWIVVAAALGAVASFFALAAGLRLVGWRRNWVLWIAGLAAIGTAGGMCSGAGMVVPAVFWLACVLVLAWAVWRSGLAGRSLESRLLGAGLALTGLLLPPGIFLFWEDARIEMRPAWYWVFEGLRMVVVVANLVLMWRICCGGMHDGDDRGRDVRSRIFGYALVALLGLGWPLANFVTGDTEDSWRRQLGQEAMVAAAGFSEQEIQSLQGAESDEETPTYRRIKARLALIAKSGDGYRFVYLMGMRDGAPVFLADSEPSGSADESKPGEIYNDASAEAAALFRNPQVLIEGPSTDEWGTWITGWAPVPGASFNGAAVLLGLDLNATMWYTDLARLRDGVLGLVLVGVMLAVGSFLIVDVTARGRARQKASEDRLRMSLQGANLAGWEIDRAQQTIRLDRAWSALVGTPSDGVTMDCGEFLELVHPDDREAAKDVFRKLCQGEVDAMEAEFRVRRPEGNWRWVLCRGKVSTGGHAGSGGFVLDISARKEAYEQMRLQGAALESAANAIVICSPGGAIEWANPAFVNLTGYSLEDAVGRTPRILKSGQHDATFYDAMWQTIRSGEVWHGEIVNRKKDGSLYTEDMTITPLKDDRGKIVRYIAVKQDITARKEAERQLAAQREELKRLALVAENTTNAVVITDTHGLVQWVNAGFTRITGFLPDEVRGRRPGSFLQGPETDAATVAKIRDAVRAKEGFRETLINYTKGGVPYWIAIECVPLRAADGTFIGFMAIEQDVTSRLTAERALEAQRKRLQKINSTLLSLGDDYEENISRLTQLAGETFAADCAIYNRLEGGVLAARGRYQTPADYPLEDKPEGHLCFDVIRSPGRFLYVENLQDSSYRESDPGVAKYGLQTYVGQGVAVGAETLGSLCVVFSRPFQLSDDLRHALAIVAQAIGREELLEAGRRKLAALASAEAAQQSRFSTLLTNMEEAVLVEDSKRRVTFANASFERMFGLPSADLLGRNCAELAGDAAGFFVERERFESGISEAVARMQAVTGEVFETVDGRWLSRDFVPIQRDGVFHGYLWQYRDITAQRKTEVLLGVVAEVGRLVLTRRLDNPEAWEGLTRLIGVRLGLGRVVVRRFRGSLERQEAGFVVVGCWATGGAEQEEMTGEECFELSTAEGLPDWLVELSAGRPVAQAGVEDQPLPAAENCRSVLMIPLMVSGKFWGVVSLESTGRTRAWSDKETALLESATHLVGSRLELQRSERELLRAKEAADLASRAKSTFLATMSHEIRTPLNAVIGMTSLLQTTQLDPQQRDYAATVATSSESLLDLINDILDYSKIEAGHIEIERVPFVLADVVVEPLEILSRAASEKGLEVTYFLDPSLPGVVTGDRTRLKQVLLNLLSNAVKFTTQGEISLHVERVPGSPAAVKFSVRDTGIGIPESVRQKLFQPFVQADSSVTRRFGGTGLGLAISRRLVELMGGSLDVESEENRGSTFSFELELPEGRLERTVQTGGEPVPLVGVRVLIVDDNAVNRRFLVEQCRIWGMEPTEVSSGEEALRELGGSAGYKLVLTDFQMPGMDGLDLAGRIRAMEGGGDLRVLLLSSVMEAVAPSRRALFDGILSKPIRVQVLKAAIGDSLSGKAVHEETAYPPQEPQTDEVRVLVAEDNPTNQKVIQLMFRKLGIRPDIVSDGRKAVDAVKRHDYHVVFLDVQMAEMDGLEAAREIRRHYGGRASRPELVAITANAFKEDREACFAAGMDDYIPKPITLDRLRMAIEGVNERRRHIGGII